MRFMSFFGPSPLAMAISAILVILMAAVVFVGVNVILAFTGGPGACTSGSGEPIPVNADSAANFQSKWDALDASLDGGNAASETFNESEVSSRADQFLKEESDVDFKDIRICLHDGFGELTGSLEVLLGIQSDVKVTGNVTLTGDTPQAEITDIEIGNVPGFIVDIIEGLVEDAIDDGLADIELEHTYTPTLSEGEVKIDGQPKP